MKRENTRYTVLSLIPPSYLKEGANPYNCEYVWPGLDLIITGQTQPSTLLDHLTLEDFKVSPELPPLPPNMVGWSLKLLPILGALALGWTIVH